MSKMQSMSVCLYICTRWEEMLLSMDCFILLVAKLIQYVNVYFKSCVRLGKCGMCTGLDHSLTYMAAHLLQRAASVIKFCSTADWNLILSLQQSLKKNHFCLRLGFPYPRWHFLIQVTYVKKNVKTLNTLWPTTNNNCYITLDKDLCTKQVLSCSRTLFFRANFDSQLTKMSSLDNLSWQDTSLLNSLFGIHGAVIVIRNFKSNLDPNQPVETHAVMHCHSL